jgi:hypothetical protein
MNSDGVQVGKPGNSGGQRNQSVIGDIHAEKDGMKNSTNPGIASFDCVANGKQYDNIKNVFGRLA